VIKFSSPLGLPFLCMFLSVIIASNYHPILQIRKRKQQPNGTRLNSFFGEGSIYLLSVRNKKVIDSVGRQGHYLLVFPKVLGKGGRDDLGAGIFWRVLGLQ